jgi:pyrroline-5-carboxylate reductase
MKNSSLCFIGCGNMGRSLIGGIIADGYRADLICGIDPDPGQRSTINKLFGIEVFAANAEAVNCAEILILGVKPQLMQEAVTALSAILDDAAQPLIITIAAGIRLAAVSQWLGRDLPVVRVMPNTPSIIRAGVAALYANDRVRPDQKQQAESIMRSVGTVVWVEKESMMDVVTALSGSGPAYFFLLMEVLEQAAIDMGLPHDQARLLTLETAFGAAKMVMESDQDAATLRKQVTSPGGTTESALKVLAGADIDKIFYDALTAARDRSRELADLFGGNQ